MTPLYALEQLTVLLPQSGFVQRPLSFMIRMGLSTAWRCLNLKSGTQLAHSQLE
jgi:hypothetical protein